MCFLFRTILKLSFEFSFSVKLNHDFSSSLSNKKQCRFTFIIFVVIFFPVTIKKIHKKILSSFPSKKKHTKNLSKNLQYHKSDDHHLHHHHHEIDIVTPTDHLSPPSTTSRLSDSDTSECDIDGLTTGRDGASISSLGSSSSPPPEVLFHFLNSLSLSLFPPLTLSLYLCHKICFSLSLSLCVMSCT
jgi:hypothetical protein